MTEKNDIKEERILSVPEAVAYGLPNAGFNAVMGVVVSFNILYFVNIMGMPALLAGAVFSLAMFLYAIFCPLWGAICDKYETRFGRKKTVMLITGPIALIGFIMLYLNPRPTADIEYGVPFMPIIIWYLVFFIIFRVMLAGFYSTYTSLLPEISTDEQNRIKVTSINMAVLILGVAVGLFGPMFLLTDATQGLSREDPQIYYPVSDIGQTIADGVLFFAIVTSVLTLISLIIMLKYVKEPKIKTCDMTIKQVFIDLKEPFKDKNYRIFLLTYFLLWTSLVSLNYTLMNLITFVLALRGAQVVMFAGTMFVAATIAFILWNNLSSKIGLKKVTTLCLIVSIISFLLMQFIILPLDQEIIFIISLILVSILLLGYVGAMIFPWAIVSDIVDTSSAKKERSLSGSYMGAFNFVLSFAAATSMLIVSLFVEIFGADAKISYSLIFLYGAIFLIVAVILFQKVTLAGTQRDIIDE